MGTTTTKRRWAGIRSRQAWESVNRTLSHAELAKRLNCSEDYVRHLVTDKVDRLMERFILWLLHGDPTETAAVVQAVNEAHDLQCEMQDPERMLADGLALLDGEHEPDGLEERITEGFKLGTVPVEKFAAFWSAHGLMYQRGAMLALALSSLGIDLAAALRERQAVVS